MSRPSPRRVGGVLVGLVALAGLVVACESERALKVPMPPEDGVTKTGPCDTVFGVPTDESGFHVPECSPISYSSNPPSAGHHYAAWAAFQEYAEPIPTGYWLHSVEHGAIAFLYGCDPAADSACASMLEEIRAYRNGLPSDPDCEPEVKNRTMILPYPTLGVAFAAVAWGHYLRADCFDASLVTALIENFYGQSYEDTCVQGFDPTGGPESCGE
jgi:hypothetical protein